MHKKRLLPLAAALLALLLCAPAQAAYRPAAAFHTCRGSVPFCWFYAVPYTTDSADSPRTDTPSDAAQNTPSGPDTAAVPDSTADSAAYETEVVRLVNEIRAQYGLGALTQDASLTRLARMKSADMRDRGYFSHTSPTYGTPFDMLKAYGVSYRSAGENIAYGYRTPQAVVDGWMNSSGHRANILNGSYTRIGVGYAATGNYWTQLFTG